METNNINPVPDPDPAMAEMWVFKKLLYSVKSLAWTLSRLFSKTMAGFVTKYFSINCCGFEKSQKI